MSYNVWHSHYHLFFQHVQTISIYSSWSGSNPKSSQSSSIFFHPFSLIPHSLILLILVQFSFNSCSTFISQVSLPCIRQLIQVAYTKPLSFNENPFPVRIYETFSRQLWLWLLLLNHILHLHPTYLPNNKIYLPFPAIPHYQYPDANQYKAHL